MSHIDWRRLKEQVLAPLSRDEPAAYQRYDWASDELAEWHSVPVGGITIIEDNYCTRQELFDYYDFTVWIEAPHTSCASGEVSCAAVKTRSNAGSPNGCRRKSATSRRRIPPSGYTSY